MSTHAHALSTDATHLIDMLDGVVHEILYNLEVYRPVKNIFKPQRIMGAVVANKCKIKSVAQYIYTSIERAYTCSKSRLHLVLVILNEQQSVLLRFSFNISFDSNANEQVGEEGFKTMFQRLTASLKMHWAECRDGEDPHGFQILFYSDKELAHSTGSHSNALLENDIVKVNTEERLKLEFNGGGLGDGGGGGGGASSSSSSSSSSSETSDTNKVYVHRPLPTQNYRGFRMISGITLPPASR